MRTKLITLMVLAAALAGAVLLSPAGQQRIGGPHSKGSARAIGHPRVTGGRDWQMPGSDPYQ